MVDTIEELSALSRNLNQSSDRINAVISALNKKLAELNLGLEVWYEREPVAQGEWREPLVNKALPKRRDVSYLGYRRFDGGWELAIKFGIQEYVGTGEAASEISHVDYKPLLKGSREERAEALRVVPQLLDELKKKAEALLKSIDAAENVAKKLASSEPWAEVIDTHDREDWKKL